MIKSNKNKQYLLNFKNNQNLLKINFFLKSILLFFLVFFLSLNLVFAQSLTPIERDVRVTATVPDIVPPSTPILISPEDESNLDNAYPVFQWYESTDNKEMFYYQFILDGRVWFDNIPLIDFANDDYSLDYDSTLGIYSLVAKTPLTHGAHRWQIIAWDYGDNSASSTTWNFSIFTEDPIFTVKKIGDVNVNISSNNPDSVPQTAISLFATDPLANEPWILALGDANLKVDLVVTIPNRASQFYSQYTDDEGNWSLQLDILPRNQVIRLDFNISDVVGHTSYIRNLYIIIQQHYWPATPVPSGGVTGIPPTGLPTGMISTTPIISQTSITPTSPLPSPGIRIPIIPPKEIVHEIVEEVKESLPTRIATFITEFARSSIWQLFSQFVALFLVLLLPIITYILVLLKFYQYLSFASLKKVFIALWPWSRRKNLVFEYRNSQAAPLVRVELVNAETKEIIDWQVTNYLGQFSIFAWPNDDAVFIEVKDNNFYFPIGDQKPTYLSWYDFYQKEKFIVTQNSNTNNNPKNINQSVISFNAKRSLAIPTLMAEGKHNLPVIERTRIILSYLISYPWWFWFLSLLIVLPFVLRHPSIFNYLALVYYLVIAVLKYFYLSGAKTWQFRAIYSNAHQIDQNLILIVNDLVNGFSQAQVVKMSESLSAKINLLKSNYIFHLQAKDYAFWDGQRVISEAEYRINEEEISEFKIHPIDSANHSVKFLQPHCQLLPQR